MQTNTLTFTGAFNEYEITCNTCTGALTTSPPNTGLGGKRVSCTECGANVIAENDGGIWKLLGDSTSLTISVV